MMSRVTRFYGSPYPARLVLFASALLAVVIAAAILFAPEAFYASYGIELGGNATLSSELKAPAGALLAAGLVMFVGVFRARFAVASLATAAIVYLSYGLGRVTSIALDGMPHSGMVSAAGLELFIGAVCLLTLLQVRQRHLKTNGERYD